LEFGVLFRRNHIVVVQMNLEWKTKDGRIVRVTARVAREDASSIFPLDTIPTNPAERSLMMMTADLDGESQQGSVPEPSSTTPSEDIFHPDQSSRPQVSHVCYILRIFHHVSDNSLPVLQAFILGSPSFEEGVQCLAFFRWGGVPKIGRFIPSRSDIPLSEPTQNEERDIH